MWLPDRLGVVPPTTTDSRDVAAATRTAAVDPVGGNVNFLVTALASKERVESRQCGRPSDSSKTKGVQNVFGTELVPAPVVTGWFQADSRPSAGANPGAASVGATGNAHPADRLVDGIDEPGPGG